MMTNALKEILEKCKQNDEKAQFQLYKHLFNQMMSICFRYEKNRDDAVNLMNQGFYKILTNLDKYSFDRSFNAWVKTIMINTVIDSYRKNRKRIEMEQSVDFSTSFVKDPNVSNDIDLYIEEEQLQAMLEQLPEATKTVFNLYAIDGYSHKEISDKMEISVGTSKWHVSQARSILKKLLVKFQNKISSLVL